METCPICGDQFIEVSGPYDSKKDGYESFKMYVHETDELGGFVEVTDSCIEDIE